MTSDQEHDVAKSWSEKWILDDGREMGVVLRGQDGVRKRYEVARVRNVQMKD